MKITINAKRNVAFTLMEVLFAMILFGITSSAILSGIAFAMKQMYLCRDNKAATQILVDQTETIRLYTLDQVRDDNYYTRAGKQGIYHIRTEVVPVPWVNSYSSNLSLVRITVNWETLGMPRTRTWETYVAKYGLQNYVY